MPDRSPTSPIVFLDRTTPGVTVGHLPEASGDRGVHAFLKGVFSQWHHTPFELFGLRFVTAEQWMMFGKARLFGDESRANAILATEDPALQKRLGQLVEGFDQVVWDAWKIDIVTQGNRAKFAQNPGALRQLRATAPAFLVEANPRDWVWGAGLSADDPAIADPAHWRGQNLLGRILTMVRSELSEPA